MSYHDGKRLEHEGEARAGACPGNHGQAYTVIPALQTRNASRQKGLVLKEVEMTPGLLHGVMHLAGVRAAIDRTRERGSLSEVNLDLKNVGAAQFLRSEFYRFYVPGIGKAESGGKELAITPDFFEFWRSPLGISRPMSWGGQSPRLCAFGARQGTLRALDPNWVGCGLRPMLKRLL